MALKSEKMYRKPEGQRIWVVRMVRPSGMKVQHAMVASTSEQAIEKFMAIESVEGNELWVLSLRDAESEGWIKFRKGRGKR